MRQGPAAAIFAAMKKFFTPLFLVTLCAAFLTGCGNYSATVAGLQIELTGIERAAGGTTQVTWRLVNPNVISYLVAESSHRIYLDGVLAGTITDKEAMALPVRSKPDRSSILTPAGPAAERALAAAVAAGSGSYRVESSILIRLYGETTEKTALAAAGKVTVTAK